MPALALPRLRSLLAVCAHPDDESFGMGAVITAFIDAGTRVSVLSFTHGEASTLRGVEGDLHDVRAAELALAGRVLGVTLAELFEYPDGGLDELPLGELAAHVRRVAGDVAADALLVFDLGGITGHRDHRRATEAALAAAVPLGIPVLAWVIADTVARQLNAEFGTTFVGRAVGDVDIVLHVDRSRQLGAIAEHCSQSTANPVLRRRLELQGNEERLRWLRHPSHDTSQAGQPVESDTSGAAAGPLALEARLLGHQVAWVRGVAQTMPALSDTQLVDAMGHVLPLIDHVAAHGHAEEHVLYSYMTSECVAELSVLHADHIRISDVAQAIAGWMPGDDRLVLQKLLDDFCEIASSHLLVEGEVCMPVIHEHVLTAVEQALFDTVEIEVFERAAESAGRSSPAP